VLKKINQLDLKIYRVARFYGWTIKEIREMHAEDFHTACILIEEIKSSELLDEVTVSAYPHIKTKSQEKIHRDLFKKAYPKREKDQSSDQFSVDDLAVILSSRGAI